jgi:Zn-dependent M28 family amino/carboxypeptidase
LFSLTAPGAAAETDRASWTRVYADIEFLADDLLEGRAAGTRGYDLAARYVAAQMAHAGLEPVFDGGWFQPFPLLESRVDQAEAEFALDGQALEPGVDFLAAKNFFSEESAVAAPVVLAGFGVRAPELDHDDYAGLDVGGRIVAIFSGAPATFPNDQRAFHSSSTRKARLASELGAVGLITIRTRVDQERVAWDLMQNYAAFPRMRWVDGEGRPHDAFPGLKGAAVLSDTARGRLFAAVPMTEAEALDAAAAGTAPRMDLNLAARMRTVSRITQAQSSNVGGLLPGSDPGRRDEWIVVTAHLDGLGIGPEFDGDAIYNGAYDNASGIAFLLEAARLLAADEVAPARSVLFLAVGAEERGLLGSDYFARHPPVPIDRIVANANMDMAIMTFPVADIVAYGAEHTTLGPMAARAAEDAGFRIAPDPMPEEVIFIRSDQFSFVKQGVPAIYLDVGTGSRDPTIDGPTAAKEFLTLHYHRPSDDLTRTFHTDSMLRFVAANRALIRDIADAPQPPRWRKGNFFGETFGPDRVE